MIDLIDSKRKVIYRFTTDIQSAVEEFCLTIGSHYHGKSGCTFSSSVNTALTISNITGGRGPFFDDYSIVIVKTTVNRRGYRFEMGTQIQKSLATECCL